METKGMKTLLPGRVFGLSLALSVGALSGGPLSAADSPANARPVLLYNRHFSAPGGELYPPHGAYKEVVRRLRGEFNVRSDKAPLTTNSLADVKVLFIANPSDKAVGANPPPPHFSKRDIETITGFVQRGGGLILFGNQENHNFEIQDSNKLLAQFGLQFTNLYTDIKKLTLPRSTPLIGGLRWAYYSGNLLTVDPTHPAKPRALVTNDLSQKPLNGPRDQEGVLLAVAEPGRGRVVVVTDAGWIGDPALFEQGVGGVSIRGQDNWEIFRRLARWAAQVPEAAKP